MQTNSCDARSYAKNPPPRFHKLGDVDGHHLRFCGRIAKGYSGAPSSPLRRKKGSVLYASNYSLAAFRCSRNPTVAIAMAPMTAPVKASMVPPRLPALRVADRDRVITAPKRSGSDLMEIRDRPRKADESASF